MQSLVSRKTALAQAALNHALHFLESGNNDQAAIYYQFAAQQLQSAVKSLVLADVASAWADASNPQEPCITQEYNTPQESCIPQEYNESASVPRLQAQPDGQVCQPDELVDFL